MKCTFHLKCNMKLATRNNLLEETQYYFYEMYILHYITYF